MRYKNDKKNIKFIITRFVFSSSKCTKIRFRPGLCPDPAGGAYDASPDPLVGCGGGYLLPFPCPLDPLWRLDVTRVLRPSSTQNAGDASGSTLRPSQFTWLLPFVAVALFTTAWRHPWGHIINVERRFSRTGQIHSPKPASVTVSIDIAVARNYVLGVGIARNISWGGGTPDLSMATVSASRPGFWAELK